MDLISYVLLLVAPHLQRYSPTIQYEAMQANVDPYLIVALIEHESGYNPRAIGPDGKDLGLMQLRTTGTCLEHRKHLPAAFIMTPEYNIHSGATCLSHFVSKCHGNVLNALGKYSGRGCRPSKYGKTIIRRAIMFKTWSRAARLCHAHSRSRGRSDFVPAPPLVPSGL